MPGDGGGEGNGDGGLDGGAASWMVVTVGCNSGAASTVMPRLAEASEAVAREGVNVSSRLLAVLASAAAMVTSILTDALTTVTATVSIGTFASEANWEAMVVRS